VRAVRSRLAGTQGKAVSLAYRGAWQSIRHLPDAAAYRLFDTVADVTVRRDTRRVQRLRANLSRATGLPPGDPALEQVVRDGMRRYLHYWCDAFRLPNWDHDRVVGTVTAHNEDAVRGPLAEGLGVVGALPHMGNWDHAAAWAGRTGLPVATVAERLEPEDVYLQFLEFRRRLGVDILPLTGSGEDLVSALTSRVRANTFVPLLADRDLTARGIEVELLGEPARLPVGPAVLAVRTGAPLVPVTLSVEGEPPDHRLVIQFHDPIAKPQGVGLRHAVQEMTQQLADVFSVAIREHPADWHMLQRVFTADLDPARLSAATQPGG
jgi:KDO2-lipid IV(A) lauroyltransferase